MLSRRVLIYGLLIAGYFIPSAQALDIPLSGGSGGGDGVKIAYVDMERIFQIFPQTKFAKEDYAKRLRRKREDLQQKETELSNIRGRISVLESTLKELEFSASKATDTINKVNSSTTTSSQTIKREDLGPPEAVQTMKKELEEKEFKLAEDKKRSVEELVAFEKQQSRLILGKLYQALQDLAEEEQITLVIDKSSILYGSANIDLTQKLQKKVRGF